jgi:hypothetical protein
MKQKSITMPVHHKSDIYWTGIEPRRLCWNASKSQTSVSALNQLSISTQSMYNLNFIHCNFRVHELCCTMISMFQLLYLPKFILGKYTKISDTSFMPFATSYSPYPLVKRFLYHHNLLCFLIPWMRLIIVINIQHQHIHTSPSAAATM